MWTYIIAGVIALASLATITLGVKSHLADVKESGRVEVRAEWTAASEKRRQRERVAIAAAAADLRDWRAKQQGKVKTRTIIVEKVLEKPIYRNVCFESDGLQCVNAALRGQRTDGCKPD